MSERTAYLAQITPDATTPLMAIIVRKIVKECRHLFCLFKLTIIEDFDVQMQRNIGCNATKTYVLRRSTSEKEVQDFLTTKTASFRAEVDRE